MGDHVVVISKAHLGPDTAVTWEDSEQIVRKNSVLPGWVGRVISTSVLPKKGPKIGYCGLLNWAGGEGEQTMSLLRLGAKWLRLGTWISRTRTGLGSSLGDHVPTTLASNLGL